MFPFTTLKDCEYPTIALSAQLSNITFTLIIPSFYFFSGSHGTRSPFSNDINFHSSTHRLRTGTLTMLGPHNSCFQECLQMRCKRVPLKFENLLAISRCVILCVSWKLIEHGMGHPYRPEAVRIG